MLLGALMRIALATDAFALFEQAFARVMRHDSGPKNSGVFVLTYVPRLPGSNAAIDGVGRATVSF